MDTKVTNAVQQTTLSIQQKHISVSKKISDKKWEIFFSASHWCFYGIVCTIRTYKNTRTKDMNTSVRFKVLDNNYVIFSFCCLFSYSPKRLRILSYDLFLLGVSFLISLYSFIILKYLPELNMSHFLVRKK